MNPLMVNEREHDTNKESKSFGNAGMCHNSNSVTYLWPRVTFQILRLLKLSKNVLETQMDE